MSMLCVTRKIDYFKKKHCQKSILSKYFLQAIDICGADKMAQQWQVFASEHNDLGLIPKTHMLG